MVPKLSLWRVVKMGILNFALFRGGPHNQFEQLVEPHLERLFKYAYRLCGQRDDAEDLVQDLLLKLYPRLEEMKSIEKLGPWMVRIMYRMYIDNIRRQQRSPIDPMDGEEPGYDNYASHQPGPLESVDSGFTHDALNDALRKLSEEHRILIMLHDVEGHNLQEIHDITGLPIGTIKSRLSRARTRLREMIKKRDPKVLESVNTGTRF
jgi:RNA polymerase sigma-70 factor (ECF subfamily)